MMYVLPLLLTALLFEALAIVFLARQVKPDVDAAGGFGDPDERRAALPRELRVSQTSIRAACGQSDDDLRRSERVNLRAVTALAQIAVATVVGIAVFTFFVLFGIRIVDPETVTAWSTEEAQIWWRATMAGHEYALTSQHVRVSAFLGVFSAFYFVVSASSDRAMRASLAEEAQQHARTCLAVRAVYRAMLRV